MKIKTKTCEDCGESVVMLFEDKGKFIKYKKMCSCLTEIMRLRNRRQSDFAKFREEQRKTAK